MANRNYTEIAIVFPNQSGEGYSGPVTCAAPIILPPEAQIIVSSHPRIAPEKGALQISIVRETKKR